MKRRYTCITLFDEKSLEEIYNILSKLTAYKLCKVPYLKYPYTLKDREEADTLPYHFTLSYWDENNKEEAIKIFNTIHMKRIEVLVEDVKIKQGNEDSFNMYFSFVPNNNLKEIQSQIYNKTKNEKFNPNTYLPHISIHSDKDYNKLIEMRNVIMENFKPFRISFDKLGLFEIYPAKRIL
ncbi:MAG: hypothetical protein HFJ58_03235 [Clostridia bacterium]|nr:hypothetical protein [Clostridia bacterium]